MSSGNKSSGNKKIELESFDDTKSDKKPKLVGGIAKLLEAEEQARKIVERAKEDARLLKLGMQKEIDIATAEYKAELQRYGRSPELLAVKEKYNLRWDQLCEIVDVTMPSGWVDKIERHFVTKN